MITTRMTIVLPKAVRACLYVQESSGNCSSKSRIPPTFQAYEVACEQAQHDGSWTKLFSVQQSCDCRCKQVHAGTKQEDSLVHHKFMDMARFVKNDVIHEYKLVMSKSLDKGMWLLPSGKTKEQVLAKILAALWKKQGGKKAQEGHDMPGDWQYNQFKVFKLLGPTSIGGSGATQFLEDATQISNSDRSVGWSSAWLQSSLPTCPPRRLH